LGGSIRRRVLGLSLEGLNHLPFELMPLSLLLAWMISPMLLIWLNAALVIEAKKERRTRTDSIPRHTATLQCFIEIFY
jgi:hypothetical protein